MPSAEIRLVQIADSPFCVDVEDGQKVHGLIAEGLERGDTIFLSFGGVERLTTAFLNAAVGQLYNEFPGDVLRERLRVREADSASIEMLKKVTERAKQYFGKREI